MRKGFARYMAGILAAQMVLSSGGQFVYGAQMEYPVSVEAQDQSGGALEEEQVDGTELSGEPEVSEPENQEIAESIPQDEISGEVTEESEDTKNEETEDSGEKVEVKGEIEVQLISGIEVRDEQKFHISLQGPVSREEEVILTYEEGQAAPHKTVAFEGLEPGTYQIQISGQNYVTYAQQVEVAGMGYRLQVYTGEVEGFGDHAHPGMLVYADVNGDGTLDQSDVTKLVDAIDQKTNEAVCDLNGDGSVDLADLQYFTNFYGKKQVDATIEAFIPREAFQAAQGENTQIVGGSLEEILDGNGSVSLSPADGAVISEEHPVQVSFDFSHTKEPVIMEGLVIESPSGSDNWIESGVVQVEYLDENGQVQVMEQPIAPAVARAAVDRGSNGTLIIDLGGQIAVKKVTLKITATANQGNLAEISKVEFLNNMENHIPAPEMDIPEAVTAEAGNREITLSWEKAKNVTGYEAAISDGTATEYHRTTTTTLHITSFQNKKLNNKQEYTLKVQSLNGEWKSGFSAPVTAVPKVDTVPEAPDNLSVEGLYRALEVRWKESKDQGADTYNLYYKEDSAEKFEKIEGITGTYYKLTGLKDQTKYQVYVTGVNDLGEGGKSMIAAGTTASVEAVSFPQYKILTEAKENQELLTHVTDARRGAGNMVDSPLDEGQSAKGIVDNNFASYYHLEDWDDGVNYHKETRGLTVELDQTYEMDRITFAAPDDSYQYNNAAVYYLNEEGKEVAAPNARLLRKTDGNGRAYYLIKLGEPVTTSRVRISVSTPNIRNIGIAEVRIYEYDSLEADIQDLYADDLHLELKDTVEEEVFAQLQERLDAKDHGEYHPDREILQKELDAARALFEEQQKLEDTIHVHPQITGAKDSHLGFSGLNAWQPLGVSAAAGEELVVYVGNPSMATGANTPLRLVFSQVHAESNAPVKVMSGNLKIGRNEITVPKFMSTEAEKGGSVYVEYTGKNDADAYGIRVSGGTSISVLDLYQVTDEAEKQKRIAAYVEKLEKQVASLEEEHAAHQNSGNENLAYEYQERTCILNTTEILLDQMMLSIPASQVLAGISGGSDKAAALADSVKAMNDMMTLFYQHKGLTNSFAEGTNTSVISKNRLPAQHLNIRYMKMFAGAFMYASGNHIGIEWNETRGMVSGKPVQVDANGKKISGQYFGWGIAHEIGHNINQSAYAIAEVTNNYFSVLAQADETNEGVRFKYEDVYEKVTSSAVGRSDNVFTQLGMYWQLHLAYDRSYNYKTYSTYQEIKKNLFFARVDSYARDPKAAPAPQGVELTLTDDADQKFMRLASAAAEKDLTEFFRRWGMIPNETTKAYLGQFAPEERAIYYVNDEARAYEIENGTGSTIAGKEVVSASVSAKDSQVTVKIASKADPSVLIGYEIVRVTTEQGQPKKEVVGFTTTDTFVDQAAHLGSRAVSYEVTAIDKFTNRSAVAKTTAVKLTGDGLQDKTSWSVQTNMSSEEDTLPDADENDPCAPEKESAASRIIDGNENTVYHGQASGEDPYVILEMNKDTEVTALRYTQGDGENPIGAYRIEVSSDGQNYTQVKEGNFELEDGKATVFLTNKDIAGNEEADPWVATYNASYVKFTAVGQKGKVLSIGELDILGPSGDNVELLTDGIGKLKADYVYQEAGNGQEEQKIPAGSVVFTGTYKGNPAYNVVLLYDENGNIVGGTDQEGALTAQQIILAPDPGDALLGETSEGIWIYWIEPEDMKDDFVLPAQVRAELYRVDNALTNEGQRLVSDTLSVQVPESLPDLEIKK